MEEKIDIPVLIVGAGSAGLTLAGELAQRGIASLIIDSRDGPNVHPRASSLGPRAMEHFRRWGIAERLTAAGAPPEFPLDVVFTTRLRGHEIHRFSFPNAGELLASAAKRKPIIPDLEWSPYFKVQIGQNIVEPILADFASSFDGTDIRYGWQFESFVRKSNGIEATIVRLSDGHRARVTSRFLAGCDGARSAVRAAMQLNYKGRGLLARNKGIFFKSPHFDATYGRRSGRLLWTLAPDSLGVFIAIDGRGGWTFNRYFADDETVMDESTIWRAMGAEFPLEIISVQAWNGYELVAEQYGDDSVYLAGDAAHLFHPTGGFGMNTSIGDAIDLGWKMAAVLNGWGGSQLLETYDLERRPVAIRNGQEAAGNFDRLVSVMKNIPDTIEAGGAEGDRVRNSVSIDIAGQIRTWTAGGVHLGYSYAESPTVILDGSPEPPRDARTYVPSARPGERAPHIWLADGRSTLDLQGPELTLLRIGPNAPSSAALESASKIRSLKLTVAELPDPDFIAHYEMPLVLIRPDGHVCWRGCETPKEPGAVLDVVRGAIAAKLEEKKQASAEIA